MKYYLCHKCAVSIAFRQIRVGGPDYLGGVATGYRVSIAFRQIRVGGPDEVRD